VYGGVFLLSVSSLVGVIEEALFSLLWDCEWGKGAVSQEEYWAIWPSPGDVGTVELLATYEKRSQPSHGFVA
jgi:hypothetical protein